GACRPVWHLRYWRQQGLGQRWYGSRYRQLRRPRYRPVVADHGTESLSKRHAPPGDRRWWRQQWTPRAIVESRIAGTGQYPAHPHHRLPSAARNEQMEQDRTSTLFLHYNQLARKTSAEVQDDCSVDRGNNNQRRAHDIAQRLTEAFIYAHDLSHTRITPTWPRASPPLVSSSMLGNPVRKRCCGLLNLSQTYSPAPNANPAKLIFYSWRRQVPATY